MKKPRLPPTVEDRAGEEEERGEDDDPDAGPGAVSLSLSWTISSAARKARRSATSEVFASSGVPTKAKRPFFRNAIRSATKSADVMSCVTTTEVVVRRVLRSTMSRLIVIAVTGSRPVVGSS